MIETLDLYDKEIMLFLNFDGGAWLDQFLYLFSAKTTWIATYVAIIIQLFISGKSDKSKWISLAINVLFIILIILLADRISSGLIKHWVERPRPSHSDIEGMLHYVNDYKGGMFGFVSSHAANSIGLGLWLCLLYRTRILCTTMILWVLTTCYSRIYLGVHYLGDILGGLTLGIVIVVLIHYLYCRFINEDLRITDNQKEPWLIITTILATVIVLAVCSLVQLYQ